MPSGWCGWPSRRPTPRPSGSAERALGRLRGQRRASWWLPDGALPAGEDAPAGGPRPLHTIEVELTPKHLARLQQVFEDRYPGEVQTTYFTPPAHQAGLRARLAVLEQATRARNEPWSQVTVVPLPVLPGASYRGGGMNVAPSSTTPRAARRTSCLGTFLLVLVLWSLSVVALAAYLVTRSAIVRQVRFAWWAVFLAAAALLGVEVAIFEATGDGLADLLRLHVHPWWLLLHGYGIGSLVTWPLTIVACQAPLGIPVGAMAGALSVARAERLAAGAEWSPYSQRHALVAEVHAVRQVARATRRHHEPTNPARTPALGIAYPGGDLYPWLRRRGRITEVVIPEREQRLAMAVLGIPGSGKTVTLLRRVWIAARSACESSSWTARAPTPGWPGRSPAPTASPTPAPSLASGPPNPWTVARGRHGHRQPAPGRRGLGGRGRRPVLPADGHPGPPAGLHTP